MIDITSPAVLLTFFLFTGLFLSGAFLYLSLKREADLVVIANDARGELLEVAHSGDPAKVSAFLVQLGIGGI